MAADILGQIASARSLVRVRPLPSSIMLELKDCAMEDNGCFLGG